jgi:phage terminase large subunit GpA-like protein
MTADIQKDHIVAVVRGWGAEFESFLIHAEEIWGDTDQPEVWGRLTDLHARQFGGMPIRAVAVDSGYRTERVYEWIHARGAHAYATKGKDRPTKLYGSTDVEVNRLGKKLFHGMKLWTIDHSYFKGWVHDRLNWPQDQPGAWHLPTDVSSDYCRQLVAEQRMRLPSGGVQWVKSGTNDFLDCEAGQAFLAHVEGVRNMKSAPRAAGSKSLIEQLAKDLNG